MPKQSTANDTSVAPSATVSPKCTVVQNLQHFAVPAATVLAAFLGSFVATFWASISSAAVRTTTDGECASARFSNQDGINEIVLEKQYLPYGSQGEQPETSGFFQEEAEDWASSQAKRLEAELRVLKQQLASVTAESPDGKARQIAESPSKSHWFDFFPFMFLLATAVYLMERFVLPEILGRIFKMAAEHFDRQILGVDVELGNTTVDLFEGQIKIDKLKIRNPKGFQSDYLLTVNHVLVDLRMIKLLRSFTKDIEVEELTFDGIVATFEKGSQGGSSNVQVIQDRLKGHAKKSDAEKDGNDAEKKEDPSTPPPQQKGHRTTKLRAVNILDSTLRFHGPIAKLVKGFDGAELKLDDIQFGNFHREKKEKGGRLFKMADIASFLLNTLLKSVMNSVTSVHALPKLIAGAAEFGVEAAQQGVHFVEGKIHNAAEALSEETQESMHQAQVIRKQSMHLVEEKAHHAGTTVAEEAHQVVHTAEELCKKAAETIGETFHHVEEMLEFTSTPVKKKCTRVHPERKCREDVQQGSKEVHGFIDTPEKKKCRRVDPEGQCPKDVQHGLNYKINVAAEAVSDKAETIHHVEELGGFLETPKKQKCTRVEKDKKYARSRGDFPERSGAGKNVTHATQVLVQSVPGRSAEVAGSFWGVCCTSSEEVLCTYEKCPRGHELDLVEAHSVTCDKCGNQIPNSTMTYKCPACDYDVCPKCYRSLNNWISL